MSNIDLVCLQLFKPLRTGRKEFERDFQAVILKISFRVRNEQQA